MGINLVSIASSQLLIDEWLIGNIFFLKVQERLYHDTLWDQQSPTQEFFSFF